MPEKMPSISQVATPEKKQETPRTREDIVRDYARSVYDKVCTGISSFVNVGEETRAYVQSYLPRLIVLPQIKKLLERNQEKDIKEIGDLSVPINYDAKKQPDTKIDTRPSREVITFYIAGQFESPYKKDFTDEERRSILLFQLKAEQTVDERIENIEQVSSIDELEKVNDLKVEDFFSDESEFLPYKNNSDFLLACSAYIVYLNEIISRDKRRRGRKIKDIEKKAENEARERAIAYLEESLKPDSLEIGNNRFNIKISPEIKEPNTSPVSDIRAEEKKPTSETGFTLADIHKSETPSDVWATDLLSERYIQQKNALVKMEEPVKMPEKPVQETVTPVTLVQETITQEIPEALLQSETSLLDQRIKDLKVVCNKAKNDFYNVRNRLNQVLNRTDVLRNMNITAEESGKKYKFSDKEIEKIIDNNTGAYSGFDGQLTSEIGKEIERLSVEYYIKRVNYYNKAKQFLAALKKRDRVSGRSELFVQKKETVKNNNNVFIAETVSNIFKAANFSEFLNTVKAINATDTFPTLVVVDVIKDAFSKGKKENIFPQYFLDTDNDKDIKQAIVLKMKELIDRKNKTKLKIVQSKIFKDDEGLYKSIKDQKATEFFTNANPDNPRLQEVGSLIESLTKRISEKLVPIEEEIMEGFINRIVQNLTDDQVVIIRREVLDRRKEVLDSMNLNKKP